MEQFTLLNPEMSTEVLADGYHLAPELLEYAFRLKGAKRLCLVTDTNRALDQPPGRYRFGNRIDGAWFESDGKVGFEPGHGLASTVSGMDLMVANMWRMTSASLPEAVRMGSLTPAERAGVAEDCGSLEVGKLADILVLDSELGVRQVFLTGEEFKP
jgi:N-acetylglucosamine-6-phosphate deacetylase